jgi:hypothetical protein
MCLSSFVRAPSRPHAAGFDTKWNDQWLGLISLISWLTPEDEPGKDLQPAKNRGSLTEECLTKAEKLFPVLRLFQSKVPSFDFGHVCRGFLV